MQSDGESVTRLLLLQKPPPLCTPTSRGPTLRLVCAQAQAALRLVRHSGPMVAGT